ncbi:MAG: hypothetical protein LBG65_05425 [Puniceicoccales bacterium]|jgi:hypothetical protein|nr:hypothetical protein [Puniceicoccales bacterium]
MTNTSQAITHTPILPALRWRQQALYFWSAAFVAGNLALPQLCHVATNSPQGGRVFLPIYLFTLLGAVSFGWRAGLLAALASPLLNSLLFGMPSVEALPVIVVKSVLIAALAPVLLARVRFLPFAIAAIIVGYQALGGIFEWAWTGSLDRALGDVRVGWPGMCAQFIVAWAVLALAGGLSHSRDNA